MFCGKNKQKNISDGDIFRIANPKLNTNLGMKNPRLNIKNDELDRGRNTGRSNSIRNSRSNVNSDELEHKRSIGWRGSPIDYPFKSIHRYDISLIDT